MERSLAVDYSKLATGQIVSQHTYLLDETLVREYVAAVQDDSDLPLTEDGRKLAPPMSMAALSLRGVVQDLQIPGGTLHVGQEFEFASAVPVGTTLDCQATLAQNSVRGGMRIMVVNSTVHDGDGNQVMSGKSTIMLPEELASGVES
jgi:acyl dehydratase